MRAASRAARCRQCGLSRRGVAGGPVSVVPRAPEPRACAPLRSPRGKRYRRGEDAMFQIRIHGRGGQGVVTAAELLSIAAFREGKHAQAFPSFGSERMGAPVSAFCRIDDREIRLREPIVAPDVIIIQDPTLLHSEDTFAG